MKHKLTADRLNEALREANMTPQELSKRSGVNKSSISQYRNGSHKPSNISSGKMGEVLGVNPLWLMGFDVGKHDETKLKIRKYMYIQLDETMERFIKNASEERIRQLLDYTEYLLTQELKEDDKV